MLRGSEQKQRTVGRCILIPDWPHLGCSAQILIMTLCFQVLIYISTWDPSARPWQAWGSIMISFRLHLRT